MMFEKLAKDAVQGLRNAEKAGDAAKNILEGAKKAEQLASLAGKVPEPVLEALRKLIAEAKQRLGSEKSEELEACVKKAQALLESGNISAESVAALTAELTALLKKGGTAPQAGAGRKAAPAPAQTAAPKAAAVQFTDVKKDAYYYDAVQWAVQKGVASGTSETTFGPDQNCTRAQAISFLWRAAGSPAPKAAKGPFTDVADGAYYQQAVAWAAERGIVSGSTLNPDAEVTRGQLATFLYWEAGSPSVGKAASFTDVPADAYYSQAAAWVAEKGIASGTGENTFSPDAVCTRGQIVTFLYRAKK